MAIGTRSVIALAIVTCLAGSPLAVGIKETARLTILGSGLQRPIEITDPAVLTLSNVFVGTFIGGPAPEPDAAWVRYRVAFDVQTLDGVKAAAYVIYYCANSGTGEGFIYLPGQGDESYRRNISTILRDGRDGRWHQASEAWSAALNARLR
jgi:hypothetical protein